MVKWVGYAHQHSIWEPVKHFEKGSELLNQFEQKQQQLLSKKNEIKAAKAKQIARIKDLPKVGDLCFGKVRGYKPWPAFVTKIQKSKNGSVIWVQFFNANQQRYLIVNDHLVFPFVNTFWYKFIFFNSGKCTINTIFDLEEGSPYIEQHKNDVQFTGAVKEMAFSVKMRADQMKLPMNILKKYTNLI